VYYNGYKGVDRQWRYAGATPLFLKELDPLLELAEGQELFSLFTVPSLWFIIAPVGGIRTMNITVKGCRALAGKTAGAFFVFRESSLLPDCIVSRQFLCYY